MSYGKCPQCGELVSHEEVSDKGCVNCEHFSEVLENETKILEHHVDALHEIEELLFKVKDRD